VTLGGTTQLKNRFNEAVDDPVRLLLVVSPTCADCQAGVTLVAAAASQTGATGVSILALWTAMRPGDSEAAAARVSEDFGQDATVSHFWEEEGWPVSTGLRPLLGLGDHDPTQSAWDVCLYYEPGVRWVDRVPPAPTEWAHNLQHDPGVGDHLSLATLARWLDRRA
jgi:hypothetical protein